MKNKLNILLIPADDRPVSYTLPLQAGMINKNINVFIPPREFLGNLINNAKTDEILQWLEKTLLENPMDYVICALDTAAYGGLIPSRRSSDSKELICSRLGKFRQIIEASGAKVLGFSSIMRISDNNVNEEEKLYWDEYGKLIFKYSYLKHKGEDYSAIEAEIPVNILEDYLKTRERNFTINKMYLQWKDEGFFDFFLYAKDDIAPFGLNVQEAEALSKQTPVHTGFDEVLTLLVAHSIVENFDAPIKIFPVYSTPNGPNIIPRYEDKPLCKNIETHIKMCGAEVADTQEDAHMILLAHTPEKGQNDLAMLEFVEQETEESTDFCVNFIKNSNKPVIVADVKNANGSDDLLARKLLSETIDLYGYAGWNTASNTIGTALSVGVIRYIAEKQGSFSQENFNKLMFVRLADDWAYQAIIRKIIRKFNLTPEQITLSFPWNRSFEVEVNL